MAPPHANDESSYGNGTNGIGNHNGYSKDSNGANGHEDGMADLNGHTYGNGTHVRAPGPGNKTSRFQPIAVCGMACRLPGGISSPQELWEFLIQGRDGRTRVPKSRFNIDGWYSSSKQPGTSNTEHGYFLDESVDLAGLDTSFFSMTRKEVEWLDPQQRLMLEVARESLEDACEVGWEGSNTGVYMGNFTQDWYDMMVRDGLRQSHYAAATTHDFMISERISHEMDLRGPSLTIRTACSSALSGLNEACMAIGRGDCEKAIVGGTSIMLAPDMATRLSGQGVLSPDGSCNTFSANANGYARGEAIVSLYLKSLSAAMRDGNPIRSIISGTAVNFDGKTFPLTMPSATAQEALIRHAYDIAGITDIAKTGFFECHGTGTKAGDPIETEAIASVFNDGIVLGALKPNLGHSEGASGLTAILKATLALEHRQIPPNIKYLPLNPKIPFEKAKLQIPDQPMEWPLGREERVSINSFGVGGSNAHVILESAAPFSDRQRIDGLESSGSSEPQLLLFSANTPQSLRELEKNYQTLLSEKGDSLNLANVAHTLSVGREHLPHRSFAIATKDKFDLAALPTTDTSTTRSIVMVFTGQGAAWPRAGRALVLSNSTFSSTIASLEKHLATLGSCKPSWSLREELLKPARSSRVNEAELSQPLCTALQIALVDTLAASGVKPAAVVGHSSGEIGAAYAAGALTAKEAIAVAFHRGLSTKGRTERGGMLAVGLGWDEVQEFLVPGVIAACDNSPSSVTLSGDEEKLDGVATRIKGRYPTALTTKLKVDKAYHSHHMLALGDDYEQAMTKSGVVGGIPSIPFFSTVKGQLLGATKADQLGPKYWRANLERPVLFRSAVSALLGSELVQNEVFLELGPHSALAGPLRQILASASSDAVYIPTLVRNQHSGENVLQALGKLYAFHVNINLRSVAPGGSCISDLPRYPWDHSRRWWSESRITKEWRDRQHPHHPLLGSKLPECTELEPMWRNLLQVDIVPWVVDHRVDDATVFPLTGYVCMAAEAARQISGINDGVSLRNLSVGNAMVLPDDTATEVITTLRPHRLTDSANSEWWEFVISSHNGHTWTKHCSGQVRSETIGETSAPSIDTGDLPHKVESSAWYDVQRKRGLTYGPKFAILEHIKSSTGRHHEASAAVRNNLWGDETQYFLHPVILDAYFQLMNVSIFNGIGRHYRRHLASSVDSMTITRCADDHLRIATNTAPTDEGQVGNGGIFAGEKTVLRMSGANVSLFDEGEDKSDDITPITARTAWVPHVDFANPSTLIQPLADADSFQPILEELAQLAISAASNTAKTIDAPPSNLIQYHDWLTQHVGTNVAQPDASARMNDLVEKLQTTPAGHAATTIVAICQNMDSLLKGESHAMELLSRDGRLDRFNDFLKEHRDQDYFHTLACTKPNLRVLEIGAGLGHKTRSIVKSMTRADGRPMYSQYVTSDALSSVITAAKERLKDLNDIEFEVLDLNQDLKHQSLEGREFDVIIAANIVSGTKNVARCLETMKTLLSPHGRLILEEPRCGSAWIKFVLGTLPSWWSHASDYERVDEPFLTQGQWLAALDTAGFAHVTQVERQSTSSPSDVFIAKITAPIDPVKRITLLSDEKRHVPELFVNELICRGYSIDHCSLKDVPTPGQDVLSFLDEEQPFCDTMNADIMSQMKAFLGHVGHANLVWVTRPSSIVCTNPGYAQIIGMLRTLRNEMNLELISLEMEKVVSSEGATMLADFVSKLPSRQDDGVLGPDYEYAIHGGQTLVNRIFPFVLEDELIVSEETDEAVMTQSQPGRLDSLIWSTKPKEDLQDEDVEVEVYASGLNFRDVLVGMQIIPGRHEPKFGYEAAGIVRRVGSKVSKLAPGDRAVAIGINTFATTITGHQVYYEKLPDNISFVQGACIPTVFITAVYGLVELARLSEGQSVLIHSGAGGVGLAAIQVARMLGATIYTTVGSEQKVQYLMDTFGLPRNQIFSSRNASFVDDLLQATNGKGVDVALNSLAGELLHATWKCVAPWGAMVEIGKRDLLGNAKLDMSPFLANRRYCCLDVEQMRQERPEISNKMLKYTMDCFSRGHFHPIRVDRVFSAPAVLEAFRYMQQGKHIGKIVVELRDASGKALIQDVDARKKVHTALDENSSYLLIGGLGGLGRAVSVWMVEHGARNLVFLSRSAGSGRRDADFKREIESMGCTVQLIRGDVTKMGDVANAVDSATSPVKGIIQMSMVLRDQLFDGMSMEDWRAVVEPKIKGTWNLHDVTTSRGLALDFFVLFSSLSGILGQVGQANYASANTFLDAFARYRNSNGLACSAIDLGAMEGIGYLSENEALLKKMQGTGWRPVKEQDLLRAMPLALMSHWTRKQRKEKPSNPPKETFLLGIAPSIPLASPESSARLRRDVRMAVYHNISASSSSTGNSGTAADGLRAFLATLAKDPALLQSSETGDFLAKEIGKKLFALTLAKDNDVNIAMRTADLGLDSLVAVELQAWWKLSFGFDISTIEMLSMGTLEALGRRAVDGLVAIHG